MGLLKKTEIKIDTASGGAEAVSLAEGNSYDLILMDQRMPEVDGTEALHKIREFDQSTPVICLTADAILGARARYISEGFTDYLTKPIDSAALERMLLKYLPKEKVIKVQETEESPSEDGADDFAALRESGIQVDAGLRYSQDDETLYRALLSEYLISAEEKMRAIRESCTSGDYKNYSIVVHALKSASKMIGAMELSEMCAKLEKASDAGESETIQDMTPAMLKLYEKVISAVRCADVTDSVRQNESDDEILEFFPET